MLVQAASAALLPFTIWNMIASGRTRGKLFIVVGYAGMLVFLGNRWH